MKFANVRTKRAKHERFNFTSSDRRRSASGTRLFLCDFLTRFGGQSPKVNDDSPSPRIGQIKNNCVSVARNKRSPVPRKTAMFASSFSRFTGNERVGTRSEYTFAPCRRANGFGSYRRRALIRSRQTAASQSRVMNALF